MQPSAAVIAHGRALLIDANLSHFPMAAIQPNMLGAQIRWGDRNKWADQPFSARADSHYPAEFSRFGVGDCPSSRKKFIPVERTVRVVLPQIMHPAHTWSICQLAICYMLPGARYRDDEGAGILHHFNFQFRFAIHR